MEGYTKISSGVKKDSLTNQPKEKNLIPLEHMKRIEKKDLQRKPSYTQGVMLEKRKARDYMKYPKSEKGMVVSELKAQQHIR